MRFRTTIWLLLVAVALWAVVRAVQKRDDAREREILDARRFLDMAVEQVERLSIKTATVDVECHRDNGDWFITSPLSARADSSKIERILSGLESLSGQESISAEQRRTRQLKLEDYGLVSPRARISVGDRLRHRVLSIGDDAPLGDLVYVKLVSATDIVAVPVSFLNVLPPSVEALRERDLLHGDPSQAVRLEIQRPDRGFIQLALVDGVWMLQQPVSCRSDLPTVEHILQTLFQLRVAQFVWDSPAGDGASDSPSVVVPDLSRAARLEPYGLADDEAVRVTVWGNDPKQRQEILFGKRTGEGDMLAYAKSWNSESIYTVSADGLAAALLPVDAVRSRAVFSLDPERIGYASVSKGDRTLTLLKRSDIGWSIVEPLQADADEQACRDFMGDLAAWRVQGFVDDATTNMAPYGLDKPTCTIRLSIDGPATGVLSDGTVTATQETGPGATPWETVALGRRIEGEDAVYALLTGRRRQVVSLDAALADDRRLDPAQILHFRNRTVLSLPSDQIRRISLLMGGVERSVSRDAAGQWKSEQEGGVASQKSIDSVLFDVANLRALNIETVAAGDLARCGLESPRAVLTFGLTGDTGIQKSILIGKAGQHGVYAMVKGQELVFVLAPGVADELIANLVIPAPSPSGGGQ